MEKGEGRASVFFFWRHSERGIGENRLCRQKKKLWGRGRGGRCVYLAKGEEVGGGGVAFADDFDFPEDDGLVAGEDGDVVGDGVAVGGHAAVGAEELVALGLELDERAGLDGLPLEGGVRLGREALQDLLARGAQQEGVVGRHEVEVVHALEPHGVLVRDQLHAPDHAVSVPPPLLRHGLLVLVRPQVLPRVGQQPHRVRVPEKLHPPSNSPCAQPDAPDSKHTNPQSPTSSSSSPINPNSRNPKNPIQ
jgi:hypothetical protein